MRRNSYKVFLSGALSFLFFFLFSQTSQAGFFDWFKFFKKNDSQNVKEIVSKVEQNTVYTLSISKQGSGVVISDDGKINCGKQCQASYPAKSKIVLKAEAGDNYKFERWNGCDKVSDGQCQTTLNKSKLVVAKFASKNASSSQKSSSSSIGKINSNKSSAVSFKSSSPKSSSSSKSSDSASNKQTQNFKTLTIKNVFYNKGKGVIKVGDKTCNVSQCVFEYDLNTSLELRAEPESNSVLSDWGYDCDYVFAPNNICNLIMNGNKTVIVHFEPRVSAAPSLKSSSPSSSSKSSSLSSFGEASSSSSLFTNNQYYLRITSPNGGESWKKGSRQTIKFTTNKFDRFITLKLYKNDNYLMNIGYYDIANSNPSKNFENVYFWIVPGSLNDGEDYKIYATITNSKELYGYEISDISDSSFAIGSGSPSSPSVSIAVIFTYREDEKLPNDVINTLCDESKNSINDRDSFFSVPEWYKKEALKYDINFNLNLSCIKNQIKIEEYQLKVENQIELAQSLRKNLANLVGYDYLAIINYTPSTGYSIGGHADGYESFSMYIINGTGGSTYNSESKNEFSRIFAHELGHLLGALDKYLSGSTSSCLTNPENGKQYDGHDIMCGIIGSQFTLKEAIITEPTAKEIKWK